MALAAGPGMGSDVDAGIGVAVVRRDLLARRRSIFRGLPHPRHAEQARRARIPRCTARNLSTAVLGDVLARRDARCGGGTAGLAGSKKATRKVREGCAR